MIVQFEDEAFGVRDGKDFIGKHGSRWCCPEFVYQYCHMSFRDAQRIEWEYVGDKGVEVCSSCGEEL
jgi:hypothetical protein